MHRPPTLPGSEWAQSVIVFWLRKNSRGPLRSHSTGVGEGPRMRRFLKLNIKFWAFSDPTLPESEKAREFIAIYELKKILGPLRPHYTGA